MSPLTHPVADPATAAEAPAWFALKAAVAELRELQVKDGSVPDQADHPRARVHTEDLIAGVRALAPAFPHDPAYLDALVADLRRWIDDGFGVPDFHDSLVAFQPQLDRRDGLRHLVLFPMYTQNGSTDRLFEAVLIEMIWPDVVADLEQRYSNPLFAADPLPRLHRRLRHELGRAVPRGGRRPADPDVHLGRHLRRPGGGPVPPRGPGRRRDHPAGLPRPPRRGCWTTRAWPSGPS